MKHIFNRELSLLSFALTICFGVGSLTHATAQEKVSARTVPAATPRSGSILSNKVAKIEVPMSVFIDNTEREDPFFPNAKYRQRQPKPTEVATGGDSILEQLKLNGFGGIGNKRWAMINGVSIYESEIGKVTVKGNLYQIVCLEMKENSVVVGIKNNSARRELKLDK